MWKLFFACGAVSGSSASGDKASSLVGWCPPLVSACPHTPWVSAQSPLQQLLAETNSSLEALRPFFFCVSQARMVSPSLTWRPVVGFQSWSVFLLWQKAQGREAGGHKPRVARQELPEKLHMIARAQSLLSLPPGSSHNLVPNKKLLWGAPMTDTPIITPARCREDKVPPSRSSLLRSNPGSPEQPQRPSAAQPTPATAITSQHLHLENKQLSKPQPKQERLHKTRTVPREGKRSGCWQCHVVTEKPLGQENHCARGWDVHQAKNGMPGSGQATTHTF